MTVIYGVLRAKVDRFQREDPPANSPKTPHLQIRAVDGNNKAWRIPVNVRSGDKSLVVFHRMDPLTSHPILNNLAVLPTGLSDLANKPRSATNALDYSRAPLFDIANGIALPPTGPTDTDDLQDVVSQYLQELQAAGGELFAFGSHWHDQALTKQIDIEFGTHDGLHDIHMNQGNPDGPFKDDNGIFQDGGLILRFPNRDVGLFFRFQTEWLPTDNNGNRTAESHEIPPAGGMPTTPGGPVVPPSPMVYPPVYIERALVNPAGEDPGKEIVVLGNTTTEALELSGWSVVDKNNNADVISGILLAAGSSTLVMLSGNGAQLTNKGGTIRLLNPAGALVHAVTYSKADAVEGRYVRFTT